MPSFDIVSEILAPNLQNVIDNSRREISTRWDFRGVETNIDWDKPKKQIKLSTDSEMHLQQLLDLFRFQLTKQEVALSAVEIPDKFEQSGKTYQLSLSLKEGLPKELIKSVLAHIKKQDTKVQAQQQGEQVRVTAKSRDLLQTLIQSLNEERWERPLQFRNFKS